MNNNGQNLEVDEQTSSLGADNTDTEQWKNREKELIKKQLESEAEFAQQRAKFMELYRQKEDELRSSQDAIAKFQTERLQLEQKLAKLSSQVDDLQTAAAIAEVGKEDELAKTQRQHNEELASFQHILEEAISQAQQNATAKYEAERIQWLSHQQQLEMEVQDLRSKLSQDREGLLTSITKLVQKRVISGNSSREDADLDYNMKKAQEDTELLKSVVSPLEEEINSLKAQLKAACQQTSMPFVKKNEVASTTAIDSAEKPSDVGCKVRELHLSLQTEKSSRTDLEMYVDVLNAQKATLAEETDRLRLQLKQVCQTLEQEKLDHTSLKRTWQMANDRFLESQRLILADLRRMDLVLTADQRRVISDMKATDVHTNAKAATDECDSLTAETADRANLSLQSPVAVSEYASPEKSNSGLADGENSAENERNLSLNSSLTNDQQRSLREPTPEFEASQTMLAKALAKTQPASLVGKRLVSEEEWEMLQGELIASREKIGRPCESCSAYECQLRGARDNEKQAIAQLNSMQRQLDMERQAMDKQQKYTQQLESVIQVSSAETEKQLTTLANKQRESERFLAGVKQQMLAAQRDLLDQLQKLTENREAVQKELSRLQETNESLTGKYSKHAQEMQDEAIDLPNTVEEMQLLVLKYREDLITTKVGQEHQEGLLKSEIMFLRDQVVAEQQERSTMEESLAQEISQLQQELVLRNSLGEELERERQRRLQVETKCKDTELSEATLRKAIADVEKQVLALDNTKTKLEAEVQRLKMKVSSLQVDLENSEAVQRDFVKLSQSLQIQLEKIRASENVVRWQHEEDVEDCSNCKQVFSVTRRKHHCRHCGQIFCIECLNKTVNSGPHQRPAKVCDVCHTILVRDATPYFCTDTLHTSD